MNERPPLRVLVVDDEPLARARVEDLLSGEKDVVVAGRSEDGEEAVEAIRTLRPDLVFLDIQMPGKTGLEVVAEVGPEQMPATIFVTAYDQHALQAFEVAAVDYLVKPFDDERFAQALARARERLRLEDVERTTRRLLAALGSAPPEAAERPEGAPAAPPDSRRTRIPVESRGQVRFVPIADIDFISASGPYAELHVGGQAHLIRERMQALEEGLDPERFFRIHRSAIVQVDRIESLRRRGSEVAVVLRGGQELPVARNRREALEARLAQSPPG
ncbi:MAG TPA: LytTR family DNA-binding domain-containing protein [Vicinamibacteria bacterium]|nr:LytTR family DNA-binding domain-containing protein [Vicinamibacteria bacterium]